VLVLDMIEILPPFKKYKYDTWRILPVKCYIDNSMHSWSCIRNINKSLLKFESNLVCAPCHHGKMIATSHSSVNTVMNEQPRQLLHKDTVGPSRVRSMGGKWYVVVIIDDYSHYSWVFFLESKDEVFEHFRSLALRLNNEHPNCLKAIHSDNGTEFKNASFDQFCVEHGFDQ
jgi:hypothetical protein